MTRLRLDVDYSAFDISAPVRVVVSVVIAARRTSSKSERFMRRACLIEETDT